MFQKFIGDKLQQQEGQGAKALEAQYQAAKLKIIRKYQEGPNELYACHKNHAMYTHKRTHWLCFINLKGTIEIVKCCRETIGVGESVVLGQAQILREGFCYRCIRFRRMLGWSIRLATWFERLEQLDSFVIQLHRGHEMPWINDNKCVH